MAVGTEGELHEDAVVDDPDSTIDLSRATRWARRLPWIVLALGLAVLVSGFQEDISLAEAEERSALDAIHNRISRAVQRQTGLLLSTTALFDASDDVTRLEFAQFVRGSRALDWNPEVRAVEWAPLVNGDVEQFVDTVRNDRTVDPGGYPEFSVRSQGNRAWMVVVSYLEPFEGGEQRFGTDLASDPKSFAAIDLARRTGEVTASAPTRPGQDAGSSAGMFLVNAVTGPNSTGEDGFLGVVLTEFDLDAMLGASTQTMPAYVLHDLGYSVNRGESERVLLSDRSAGARPSEIVRQFDVAGRTWEIALAEGAVPSSTAVAAFMRALPSALTVLAVALALYVIGRSGTIAENRAESLTREISSKNGALEQSNEWLESFTRVASHDLRSPLRAVTSLVGFIREDNPGMDESIDYNLGRIEQRIARMNVLIDDLLTLSKASDSSEPAVVVNYETIVQEVLQTVDIPESFSVRTEIAGEPAGAVAAAQFKTCIYNLVDNAIKHHDGSTGTIDIEVRSDRNHVDVAISDDGAGIAPEYLDSIFEPFRRLHPDDANPGSGIGLTTLARTATSNGGSISVDSAVGKGTTFILRWPIEDAA